MSESTVGILVLLGIATIAALLLHAAMKGRFFLASPLAALASTLAFQLYAYLKEGHLDPFAPIVLVTGAGISFVVALVVGAIVRGIRATNP